MLPWLHCEEHHHQVRGLSHLIHVMSCHVMSYHALVFFWRVNVFCWLALSHGDLGSFSEMPLFGPLLNYAHPQYRYIPCKMITMVLVLVRGLLEEVMRCFVFC